MSLAEQKTKFCALDNWFFSDQGKHVGDAFHLEMNSLKKLLSGTTLLQLGCAETSFARGFRFKYRWLASPYPSKHTVLLTSLDELPLERDSIDCVLAPLTLEAFLDKNRLLDEIDRVLNPLGHVIFYGIHPYSLWGGWLRFSNNTCFGSKPGKTQSAFSLKHAMAHRGYAVCHLSNFYFIPPFKNKKWIKTLKIFNEMGRIISPVPAGFYCLIMQKYQENPVPLLSIINQEKWMPQTIESIGF